MQADLLKRAEERFRPALGLCFGELAFSLGIDMSLPGREIDKILFLDEFVKMFESLIEMEDYSLSSFQRINQERCYHIEDEVFQAWKEAGCLTDEG